MKNIELLIDKINNKIEDFNFNFSKCSLEEGTLGYSLYYYYRYLYSKNSLYLNKVLEYLEECFLQMNNSSNLSITDLIEIGRYLCFLHAEGILESDHLFKYIADIKIVIQKSCKTMILENNLDSVVGLVAIGHLYLDFYPIEKDYIEKEIDKIINNIISFSIKVDKAVFWEFFLRDFHNPIIELDFFHGISGVLYSLSRCKSLNLYPEKHIECIYNAYRYLIQQCDRNSNILFPFDAKQRYNTFQFSNLAYGDLGIGHAILQSGIALDDEKIIKDGLFILKHVSKLRDDHNQYIKDAELIYGASGLMSYFELVNRFYPTEYFRDASNYWLNKIQTLNEAKNSWAGFETYMNGYRDEYSHGIIWLKN